MSEQKHFTLKEFKKAYQLADNVYSLSVILNDFCEYNSDDEDIRNIIPLIKFIRKQADELDCFFCDVDMNISEDEL